MSEERGRKDDAGKPPMSLLDRTALSQIAKVLAFGAKKYGMHNWRGGLEIHRLLDAALRHIYAFADGENNDSESGLSHLAHAQCMLMMAQWMHRNRPDVDDRYQKVAYDIHAQVISKMGHEPFGHLDDSNSVLPGPFKSDAHVPISISVPCVLGNVAPDTVRVVSPPNIEDDWMEGMD